MLVFFHGKKTPFYIMFFWGIPNVGNNHISMMFLFATSWFLGDLNNVTGSIPACLG